VVGGAAMALAYDATRVTRDIDATFVPHGVVIDEARHVADDLGLPYWWLNEQASVATSTISACLPTSSGCNQPGKPCRSARTSIQTNHCRNGLPLSCKNSSGEHCQQLFG
jgi:hypothetical protein